MKDALSIDLEDWFCAHNLGIRLQDWENRELRVVPNTRRLLDLFDRHHVHATFFVLGWIAERVPDLVQEIESRGHEIATHGYSHTLLTETTPAEFEADLCQALEITRRLVKQPILGFRAPSFTITNKTLWAMDILARNGIKYDSSIFPVSLHPDYGIPDAGLSIHRVGAIAEVPLSVAHIAGRNIPCCGGGYFRVFPYAVTRWLMRQCHREGRPVVFYVHPWEVDPAQPRMQLSFSKNFRHYMNLDRTLVRLDHLLNDFEFGPLRDVLALSGNGGHN